MRIAPARFLLALLTCAVVVAGGAVGAPTARAASTGASAPQTGKIVGTDPSGFTPHVLDGKVLTLAKVGALVVVGGSFTTVREAGSTVDIPRRNAFAFDAATGKVSLSFVPNPNGTVQKVLPSADGASVYLGGNFTSITSGGVATTVSRLTLLTVSKGARVTTFSPGSFNGEVRDLEVTGNRLWVAGKFTHLQGRARKALGTLNATTGAYDASFTATFAGLHRPEMTGAVTSVLDISTDRSNSRLVAIGNFTTVNGATRRQIAMFNIADAASSTLANWYTTLFESPCASSFETYMSDVQYSPDGSYFVVATAGGYGGATASTATTSGCDVVARFEGHHTGLGVRPTWGTYTGGDTTWTVEVTDNVVYAGGHQRWQNNPTGNNVAGQGAVARTGIAALNPVNGMPYRWNPTRTRGVGVEDMLATDAGLFVGSDTTVFNGETHQRIAFAPLLGGTTLPVDKPLTLPGDVFSVASAGSQLTRRGFDGTVVTSAPAGVPNGPGWGTSVGAFMLDGTLYTAYSDGRLTKQTFDGTNYGTPTAVNTADLLVHQTDWHGTDVPAITSLFYFKGRIYFTRSGSSVLWSRGFEPESDVVGQLRHSTSAPTGISYSSMRGAFVAGGKLYFASSTGTLSVADWNGTSPVGGTAKVLTTAGTGWASRAMFVYQGPPLPTTGTASQVAFVAAASSEGNRTSHSVSVPNTVQAGDQLLLFLTSNTVTPSYSAPAGWTLLQTQSGDNTIAFAYGKTATTSDAGTTVTITTSNYAKSVMTVAAYQGGSVTSSAAVLEATNGTRHTTPPVTAPDSQQWLVSYWSDKGTDTTTWTLPSGVTRRVAALGTGASHTSSVLADSNGSVASGSRGSLVATTNADSSAAVNFSVLIG